MEITNLQKRCYRACLEQNRELLLRGAGAHSTGNLSFNNVSMMLRHCCNHPWLIREIEESAIHQLAQEQEVREPAPTTMSCGALRYYGKLLCNVYATIPLY